MDWCDLTDDLAVKERYRSPGTSTSLQACLIDRRSTSTRAERSTSLYLQLDYKLGQGARQGGQIRQTTRRPHRALRLAGPVHYLVHSPVRAPVRVSSLPVGTTQFLGNPLHFGEALPKRARIQWAKGKLTLAAISMGVDRAEVECKNAIEDRRRPLDGLAQACSNIFPTPLRRRA